MARKRTIKENKGLPARWRYFHGKYYYRVPPGQESQWEGKQSYPLGKTLAEAYKEYASKIEIKKEGDTIRHLLDRYSIEVVPTKAPSTQKHNIIEVTKLIAVFGETKIDKIIPRDVYKYIDARTAKTSAKREIALLSHAFTKAVEWGYINKHPFKGEVRVAGAKPRDRYVEDWEVNACLSLPAEREKGSIRAIQAYIRLKLLTGLRMGDLLRIKVSDCKDDGIYVTTSKTGKAVIYAWSEELRKVVDECISVRPIDIAPYLFCTKKGDCYVDKDGEHSGWNSMWQRFMTRMLEEKHITERFHEHDLRAKVATDAKSLEHASAMLTHADSRITKRVYIRKAETVQPAR